MLISKQKLKEVLCEMLGLDSNGNIQICKLKKELEELKLKKDIAERDIQHLVKLKEEKLDLEFQKKEVALEKEFQQKEMALQKEFQERISWQSCYSDKRGWRRNEVDSRKNPEKASRYQMRYYPRSDRGEMIWVHLDFWVAPLAVQVTGFGAQRLLHNSSNNTYTQPRPR
jgi:hypothetical protein